MGLSSCTDSSWRYDISIRNGEGSVREDSERLVSDEENIDISTDMFKDSYESDS